LAFFCKKIAGQESKGTNKTEYTYNYIEYHDKPWENGFVMMIKPYPIELNKMKEQNIANIHSFSINIVLMISSESTTNHKIDFIA
ncbi:hypothetical protein COBT_001636, partial [Conglomerata obtusa]